MSLEEKDVPHKRLEQRARAFLGGRAIFNNGRSSMDCLIRNISSRGAMILLSEALNLPASFVLEVETQGRAYRARTRWRRQGALGVEFLDAAPIEAAGLLGRETDDVQHENVRLQKLTADLAAKLDRLGGS